MSEPKTASRPQTIQAIRGMEDILPSAMPMIHHLENTARRVFACYGYSEIRTPIVESTELFARSAGEASDVVVSKQMYTFDDGGGRSNTLRPEGTAGVVRAMVEHGRFKEQPIHKLYYIGSMFRYEKPQKGRQRQFNQVGTELFGVAHPAADAEIIALCHDLLKKLGISNPVSHINTIGCATCRGTYNELLRTIVLDNADQWCSQCRTRASINPMRVFDCKVPACIALTEKLPRITESVCEDCRSHHSAVKVLLDAAGVEYKEDASLVRGFDYYTRTVFEVMSSAIGAQSAILGGGRYDGLVQELGGPAVPAVGMGVGVERLVLALEAAGVAVKDEPRADYYALALDDAALAPVTSVVTALREAGRSVLFDCQPRSAKSGFKAAGKSGARYTIVLGSDEAASGSFVVKNMDTQEQETITREELLNRNI